MILSAGGHREWSTSRPLGKSPASANKHNPACAIVPELCYQRRGFVGSTRLCQVKYTAPHRMCFARRRRTTSSRLGHSPHPTYAAAYSTNEALRCVTIGKMGVRHRSRYSKGRVQPVIGGMMRIWGRFGQSDSSMAHKVASTILSVSFTSSRRLLEEAMYQS